MANVQSKFQLVTQRMESSSPSLQNIHIYPTIVIVIIHSSPFICDWKHNIVHLLSIIYIAQAYIQVA